jgi:hypothetical protein
LDSSQLPGVAPEVVAPEAVGLEGVCPIAVLDNPAELAVKIDDCSRYAREIEERFGSVSPSIGTTCQVVTAFSDIARYQNELGNNSIAQAITNAAGAFADLEKLVIDGSVKAGRETLAAGRRAGKAGVRVGRGVLTGLGRVLDSTRSAAHRVVVEPGKFTQDVLGATNRATTVLAKTAFLLATDPRSLSVKIMEKACVLRDHLASMPPGQALEESTALVTELLAPFCVPLPGAGQALGAMAGVPTVVKDISAAAEVLVQHCVSR